MSDGARCHYCRKNPCECGGDSHSQLFEDLVDWDADIIRPERPMSVIEARTGEIAWESDIKKKADHERQAREFWERAYLVAMALPQSSMPWQDFADEAESQWRKRWAKEQSK